MFNIGFAGPGGSGKTYVARYMMEKYGCIQGKLALPLYSCAEFYMGMSKTLKDRGLLQKMGDIGRTHISKDIYINRFLEDSYIIQETYKEKHNKEVNFVLDDVRYANEVKALKEAGWILIYLNVSPEVRKQRLIGRDGVTQEETLSHASETEMETFKDQLLQLNAEGTLAQTYQNLEELLEYIRQEGLDKTSLV